MPEHARQHIADAEAVPEAVRHEEKTVEMPAVPDGILLDQETVPVRSSLDKMLQHETLRKRSARDEDER